MTPGFRNVVVLAVAAFGIQLVPVERHNPPVTGDLDAPQAVESALRRCCYDCHSHETAWRWYTRVAPASWLAARDVSRGRESVNFSAWSSSSASVRATTAGTIVEAIEQHRMPIAIYRWVHPESAPTTDELAAIREWATSLPRPGRSRT